MKTVAFISIIARVYESGKPPRFVPTGQGAGFTSVPEAVADFNARKTMWAIAPNAAPPVEDYRFRFALVLGNEIVDSFDAPKQAYIDATGDARERLPETAPARPVKTSFLPGGEIPPYWGYHNGPTGPEIPASVTADVWARMQEYAAHFPKRVTWGCVTPGLNHWFVCSSATRRGLNDSLRAGYCCWEIAPLITIPPIPEALNMQTFGRIERVKP